MRNLFILYIVLLFVSCKGQNHYLTGQIEGYPESMVYIVGFNGDQDKIIDSLKTNISGKFSWNIDKTVEAGMYRIMIGGNSFLDIFYNTDDISFHTLAQSPQKSASFSKSKENIIFYDYLHKKNEYLQKIDLLEPLIVNYPESDPFYKDVLKKYESLNTDFDKYINAVKENDPFSMASLFITYDKPLPLNMKYAVDEQEEYIKKNYFAGLKYEDSRLLKMNILPNKIIGYLSLYRDPSFSKDEQEVSFIEAVDSILNHMMDNEDIYNFSLQYLIEGFEAFGFDEVVSHIANTYSPIESCVNEKRKSELEKRIENIKKLSTGNIAPNIQFGAGENDKLDKLDSKYNLVFFWSTWCPHCKQLIPPLIDFYDKYSEKYGLEIISVSVDSSKTDYDKFLKQFPLPWKHYADYKGWNTAAAIDYSIYATPMIFLLNDKREILAKPMSVYELVRKLEAMEE